MLSDNTNNSQLHSAELSILFDFHADYQLDLFRGKMFVRSDQVPSRENRCCARRSESCVNREREKPRRVIRAVREPLGKSPHARSLSGT